MLIENQKSKQPVNDPDPYFLLKKRAVFVQLSNKKYNCKLSQKGNCKRTSKTSVHKGNCKKTSKIPNLGIPKNKNKEQQKMSKLYIWQINKREQTIQLKLPSISRIVIKSQNDRYLYKQNEPIHLVKDADNGD